MANFTAEEYEKSLVAQGGSVTSTFTGANREFNSSLEVGDEFTIPQLPFKVYNQPIVGASRKYQYLRVEVTTSANTKEYKNIGSSVFNRRLPLVDEEGTPTGVYGECDGSASAEFRKHGKLQDAFAALAGKKLAVKDKRVGMTRSFDPTQPYAHSTFFTIDIVEK